MLTTMTLLMIVTIRNDISLNSIGIINESQDFDHLLIFNLMWDHVLWKSKPPILLMTAVEISMEPW